MLTVIKLERVKVTLSDNAQIETKQFQLFWFIRRGRLGARIGVFDFILFAASPPLFSGSLPGQTGYACVLRTGFISV